MKKSQDSACDVRMSLFRKIMVMFRSQNRCAPGRKRSLVAYEEEESCHPGRSRSASSRRSTTSLAFYESMTRKGVRVKTSCRRMSKSPWLDGTPLM
jgi:hypothetical protein